MAAALAISASSGAFAATITLSGSDGFGASSFNAGTNWTGGQAPSAGNDYVVDNTRERLRTPANGSSFSFAGDSLTIANGFSTGSMNGGDTDDAYGFTYKGTGTTATITVGNLILAGGSINHLNGTGDLFRLAGHLSVTGDSIIRAKQGTITIDSVVSGGSDLYLGGTDGLSASRAINFTADNTFTGDIIATSTSTYLALTSTGTFSFNIGAAGVNNSIFGMPSTNATAIFDGTFSFNLSGAATAQGSTWTIVDNSTLLESYGATFAVDGFSDLGGGIWSNGSYEFDQGTGLLTSVIPEPSSFAALAGLAGLALAASRRRRQAV